MNQIVRLVDTIHYPGLPDTFIKWDKVTKTITPGLVDKAYLISEIGQEQYDAYRRLGVVVDVR